jgi:hypothetical protein
MRYFLKKINETVIIEVSQEQYTSYQNQRIDNNMYVAASIRWQITGPMQTVTTPIKIPGVLEINQRAVTAIETTIPGISNRLSNLMEFYSDIDYVVPKNIN